MSRILLDTSAYSFLKRGHSEVQKRVERAEAILLNPIVAGEILSGYAKGSSLEKNRGEYDDFIDFNGVDVVPLDEQTAHRYAFLYEYLRKAGTMVSPNDLWIAASAMQHGVPLVTLDRDFLKIPQILVDCFDPL